MAKLEITSSPCRVRSTVAKAVDCSDRREPRARVARYSSVTIWVRMFNLLLLQPYLYSFVKIAWGKKGSILYLDAPSALNRVGVETASPGAPAPHI